MLWTAPWALLYETTASLTLAECDHARHRVDIEVGAIDVVVDLMVGIQRVLALTAMRLDFGRHIHNYLYQASFGAVVLIIATDSAGHKIASSHGSVMRFKAWGNSIERCLEPVLLGYAVQDFLMQPLDLIPHL